jgi:hypothetical protein
MPRWRVDIMGKLRRQPVGVVEAADEKSAIEQAARQFHITPARRFKIRVTRTQASEKRARESSD